MNETTVTAPPQRRPRTPAPKIDRAEQALQVQAAIAEREAMRQRGEVPPLPDPRGRRRPDRLLRMVCGADIRRREDEGTVTLAEFEWMTSRREHLAAWQHGRSQRLAARKAGQTTASKEVTQAEQHDAVTTSTAPAKITVIWSHDPK